MPKRGIAALFITTAALILLLNFRTPDETLPARTAGLAVVRPSTGATPTPPGTSPITGRSTPTPGSATPTRGTATPAPTVSSGGSTGTTVDGPVVDTQYGSIQVEVVVANGQVKDVVALQLPTGRRSGQISTYSAPILRQEALKAQSASIDAVSGATYTSDAYARSLQAALDRAGHG